MQRCAAAGDGETDSVEVQENEGVVNVEDVRVTRLVDTAKELEQVDEATIEVVADGRLPGIPLNCQPTKACCRESAPTLAKMRKCWVGPKSSVARNDGFCDIGERAARVADSAGASASGASTRAASPVRVACGVGAASSGGVPLKPASRRSCQGR